MFETQHRGLRAGVMAGAVWMCASLALAGGQGGAAKGRRYTVPELVRTVSPAVVFIGNVDRKGQVQSIGSGFVVDAGGTIVTNYHVIEGAHDLQVKMKDGEIYDRVEVLDYDTRRDLAVIKVRAFKPLPVVTLASADVEVGEDAVAIGNPKGLEHTVSAGIVSAFRQAEGYRLIQISVPISPGSSGGPLFNLEGRVIGITSAGVVAEGAQNLNFAVPIDYVRPLLSSRSAPVPVAEFTAKMGGAGRPGAAGANARGGSPASSREPEIRAAWRVVHDHGDVFTNFCLGTLFVAGDQIGFTNEAGIHNWMVPLSAIKEIAKNAAYGADKQAFHIRLVTNTNYNLIAVNDQLQYLGPDMLIIEVMQAMKGR
jgi:S1-C subfamily serine protease